MIVVNGKEYQWRENLTIEDLLISMDYTRKLVVVQINNRIIDKSRYREYLISDGMEINIIKALSGG